MGNTVWRMSGLFAGVICSLVSFGQHPGWVQGLPWVRANAWQLQLWSAGETVSFQHQVLLSSDWSLVSSFTQIGSSSRWAFCAGTKIRLSKNLMAQMRAGCVARRWATIEGARSTLRPNFHLLLRGNGGEGRTVILAFAFIPEGQLPRIQAREELVIQLNVFAERHGQRIQARCTWTPAGLALAWRWFKRLNERSRLGLSWRMLPGYFGIHGTHELRTHQLSFGLLRGLHQHGFCLTIGLEAC